MFKPSTLLLSFATLTSLAIFPKIAQSAGQVDDSKFSPLVRSFEAREKPKPVFEGKKFIPYPGETISFIGGTNTFDLQNQAYLEALLQIAYPQLKLKVRNLAWQGDTVFEQTRPRFFFTKTGDKQPGSTPDQRKRIKPGIVFVNFGKMESLETGGSLTAFNQAYQTFLDQLQTRSRRIVLVSPTPFFPVGPASMLADERNKKLIPLESSIRSIAKKRNLLYLDLLTPLLKKLDPSLSTDGIHLSDSGQRQVALLTARSLKFPIDPATAMDSPKLQALEQALRRKDFLWQQYYHPTNFPFLYGDRQSQPASRSHIDKDKRWFREEIGQIPGLISETENDIHRYAAEAATSLAK